MTQSNSSHTFQHPHTAELLEDLATGRGSIAGLLAMRYLGEELLRVGELEPDDEWYTSLIEAITCLSPMATPTQGYLLSIADVPPEERAHLHVYLVRSWLAEPTTRQTVTRKQWYELIFLLEEVWEAQRELVEQGSTQRLIPASSLPSAVLEAIVMTVYERSYEQERASIDWKGLDWEEMKARRTALRVQVRHQMRTHPAVLELGRRGIRCFGEDAGK